MLKVSKGSHKLNHIYSINTLPYLIPFCYKGFKNKRSVCHYCYSVYSLYSFRSGCVEPYKRNTELLCKPLKEIPVLNYAYVRINSHGELINKHHFDNIVKIAAVNKWCKFSLFTKRLDIIRSYKKEIPGNITLVYSNPKLDKPLTAAPEKFHKVFNVITDNKKFKVNCKLKCIDCLQCFKRTGSTSIIEHTKNYTKNVNTARKKILALFIVYQ